MNVRFHSLTSLIPIAGLTFTLACGHDQPGHVEADIAPVQVEVVEVELISDAKPIDVRGIVRPARQAAVSSRVMGPVLALKVRAGAAVTKGQAMLEIQPEAANGQLAQAKGALAQAQAALALAERNFERFRALRADNAASELELDMARMQYDRARGAVEQAEGAVRAASSVAAESEVSAPFAARVVETLVEVGDLAAPGRPLVRIESLDGQQIWLAVRESDIGRVLLGDQIGVRFDALPDLGVITGSVQEIVPSADPATHTFTVKVGLGAVHVPSGFSGRAAIAGDTTDRLVVPIGAVHHRGGLELVIVRDADGTSRTRVVTVGDTLGDGRIEVLSGVSESEMVVVDAPGPMADGVPLEVRR